MPSPSARSVSTAAGIESCRNPAVLVNTSIRTGSRATASAAASVHSDNSSTSRFLINNCALDRPLLLIVIPAKAGIQWPRSSKSLKCQTPRLPPRPDHHPVESALEHRRLRPVIHRDPEALERLAPQRPVHRLAHPLRHARSEERRVGKEGG